MMKKKRGAKKVSTIDGLARLMQGEFLGIHKEFAGVHEKFTKVNEKFGGIDEKFTGVHVEFSRVHKRIDTLEDTIRDIKESSSELFTKLDEFISLYRDTKQELTVLARHFRRLEARVAQLESRR